jgi:hypothetical protein
MPRLKSNRKEVHQTFHTHNMRGEGKLGDMARWVLKQGKKGLIYSRNHSADVAKLAAVAVKLYQGDTSSLKTAIQTAMSVFGVSEIQALKNVIQDKKEDVKPAAVRAVSAPAAPPRSFQPPPPPRNLKPPKFEPPKRSNNPMLDQIQMGKKLRSIPASAQRSAPLNNSGLSSMLDAIRARRTAINPDADDEQSGVGAKDILLKLAKRHLKNTSKDKTLPSSKVHVVGRGHASNVLGGISTISGALSTIPGPHEIVTVPLTVVAGIASGIAKMFGGMKGTGMGDSVKSIKKMIFDRIVAVRNDMADGGYIPSLKQLAKEIVMDVVGHASKTLETKVRSMLGNGLKPTGMKDLHVNNSGMKDLHVNNSGMKVKKIKGSGLLDVSVKFLTQTALPAILKKMGLNLTPRDLNEVQKMVKQIVGNEPLTIKRAIAIAQEIAPHLYRLYKGKMGGTGLKLPGEKQFTVKLARELTRL